MSGTSNNNAPEATPGDRPVLAISATFTAEAILEFVEFWMKELGESHDVKAAPFNQVFQQLLDPASLLSANRSGMNVVLIRVQDLAGDEPGVLEQNLTQLAEALQGGVRRMRVPLLICFCPNAPDWGETQRAAEFEQSIVELLGSSAHVVTSAELRRLYPVEKYYDAHGDKLARLPYTPAMSAALGTLVARKLHSRLRSPYKVLALDCDDTLWKGICGEDGPEGVVIDGPRRRLQEFALAQQRSGMLLTLCSKNNEKDVLDTFAAHPEMPLKLEHFVARRLNWEAKSRNLASLASELNLGLDSFVFLDDNPSECAEVQASHPGVATLPLPVNAAEIERFLQHVWAFDRWSITKEDTERTTLYAQQRERVELERQSGSLQEFLDALNLVVQIGEMTADQIPRVSQLTMRTNQMNFTTVRRNEAEIERVVGSKELECLTVQVSDRFGHYGLTGVILFGERENALRIDTFLLSCRALGRGVEHRMMARLGAIAVERGLESVEAPITRTERNEPARKFLASIGGSEEGGVFRAKDLADLTYVPAGEAQISDGAEELRQLEEKDREKTVDFARIASCLSTADQVLAAVKAGRVAEGPIRTATDEPRTETEARVAKIWADLLHRTHVGVNDNFFDLGGHSLLAVQLLSIVNQVFGVELSLKVVYATDFTVAELAKAIELEQLGGVGADEYAGLLEELEGLTDEEAEALLAAETDILPGENPRS